MKKNLILRMLLVSVFSALTFVCTAFISIPYAGGAGYFNLGDVITIFVGIFIGPIEGAIVGMIAGGFADFMNGYAAFIPYTIVAKLLLGFISGGFHFFNFKNTKIRYAFPSVAIIAQAGVYLLSYFLIYADTVAAFTGFGFDLIQGVLGFSFAIVIVQILNKQPSLKLTISSFYRS